MPKAKTATQRQQAKQQAKQHPTTGFYEAILRNQNKVSQQNKASPNQNMADNYGGGGAAHEREESDDPNGGGGGGLPNGGGGGNPDGGYVGKLGNINYAQLADLAKQLGAGASLGNKSALSSRQEAAKSTREAALKARKKAESDARKKDRKDAKEARDAVYLPLLKDIREEYPRELYGRISVPIARYTEDGIKQFGARRAVATNEQLMNRARAGFTGDGEYFRGNGMYVSDRHGHVGMRPTSRFSGEGGFFDDLGGILSRAGDVVMPVAKNVLRAAAPIVGDAFVPGIGGMVASGLANQILGEGEYEMDDNAVINEPVIKYNNLINSGSVQTKTTATIESAGDETGDLIFTHNEYIHDLTSKSNAFHTLERFEINPGLYQSFPLLSQFAQHFEEYDFQQCIFEFKSLVTEGNATAAGSIMLSPNYNAANPTLPDKRSIENSTGSVSGKVTATLFCGIECANDKTAYGGIKYVRTVDIDSAGRRMYDLGFMQIAASGVPAGLAIGELWCRYRVRLSKMKVGALKVVPMSDGLTLQQLPPDGQVVSSNPFFMNETADFTHKPSEPATIVNGQLICGDEFTSVSLAKVPNDGTSGYIRRFTTEVGVIGASQYDVIVQYTYYHDTPGAVPNIYSLIDIGGTTCTIPYNSSSDVTEYKQAGANFSSVATWTNKTSIIFGTPGQVGKMNLVVNVACPQTTDFTFERVVAASITIRRVA